MTRITLLCFGVRVAWRQCLTSLVVVSLIFSGTAFGQGHQAPGRTATTPQEFGAKADGIADDTAAVQTALDAGSRIYLPAGIYRVTQTLRFDSRTAIFGDGRNSIIKGDFDGPILASRSYFAKEGTAPTGWVVLRDFAIEGSDNGEFTQNHGILLRDFYSTVENIEIRRTGGHGIFLTAQRDDGRSAAQGTLVENRIKNVAVRGSWQTSYFLGERGNRKLTDGYLYSCVSQATKAIESHLFIGSAGGWRIEDFHGYGKITTITGAEIVGGFRTKLRGVHLQNFRDVGISFRSTQESVSLEGVTLDSDSNVDGAYGIRIGRNADYRPHVQITNFSITKDYGDNQLTALYVAAGSVVSLPSGIALQGHASDKITKYEIRGELRTNANQRYHLSTSVSGMVGSGTHRRVLGPLAGGGVLEDLVLSVVWMGDSIDNEVTIEMSLSKASADGEIPLLATAARIDRHAGQGFATTSVPGPGVTQPRFRKDTTRVEKGDLIFVDIKINNNDADSKAISDAAVTLTVQTD